MNKKHLKELNLLNQEADKILKKHREDGNDIEWGLAWLIQLYESIIERDFKRHNSAYIWFKNASRRNKEFEKVYHIVCKMTSKIYIKP